MEKSNIYFIVDDFMTVYKISVTIFEFIGFDQTDKIPAFLHFFKNASLIVSKVTQTTGKSGINFFMAIVVAKPFKDGIEKSVITNSYLFR